MCRADLWGNTNNLDLMELGTTMMTRKSLLFAMAILPLLSCGCASLDLWPDGKPNVIKASEKNPVAKMIALWQPAKGAGLKGEPARGFACQVMFFTSKDAAPVMVNGKIRIYLFDDVGSQEEQAKPIRQFDFEPDAWNTHAKFSKLGPAYNIFIPYTRPGSHLANCTLTIRYTPAEGGPTVFSEESQITLDGTKRDQDEKIQQTSAVKSSDERSSAVKQAYTVASETIIPERLDPSAKERAASERRVVALEVGKKRISPKGSRDYEIESENDDVAQPLFEDDEFHEDEYTEGRETRRPRRSHRSRRRHSSGHPLQQRSERSMDEYDREEELHDDRDVDEFDQMIRNKQGRSQDHPLSSELDAISVDLSRLRPQTSREYEDDSTFQRKPRRERRSIRPRDRHPLETRPTDDFDRDQEADYGEFDDEGRTFTIRTRR